MLRHFLSWPIVVFRVPTVVQVPPPTGGETDEPVIQSLTLSGMSVVSVTELSGSCDSTNCVPSPE